MFRNPSKLGGAEYDLLIIGAGIYGICAAWDAVLRGLSVAIVERDDFCSATSANPLKIVHGGFRYIQHADIRRIRQSSHERNVLMRVAPHLVDPIPFLIPTYGHGMEGKEVLCAALSLYNLFAWDRNRGVRDPAKRVPWGELMSRDECMARFPDLKTRGLTGAVAFYDGQMYNPIRLALSYLRSAVDAGVDAVNYMEVTDLLRRGDRVAGAKVRDLLTGAEGEVAARMVINTSGPWTEKILTKLGLRLRIPLTFTKDLYFIVTRGLDSTYALAVPGMENDPRAIASRGRRHFFFIPWRDHTLVGSSHVEYRGEPDEFAVTDEDVQALLDDVNAAYPISLDRKDISKWNSGMVPCGDTYGSHAKIIDHAAEDGIDGLITVTSVRWTVSRYMAAKAVGLAFDKLGRKAPKSVTADTPVFGGRIDRFDDFARQALDGRPKNVSELAMRVLLHTHGSEHARVLRYVDENPAWAEPLGQSCVIGAEVIHAVREEMAQKLSDVVHRRTELGTAENPDDSALQACAGLMAGELGWTEDRVCEEIEDVKRTLV